MVRACSLFVERALSAMFTSIFGHQTQRHTERRCSVYRTSLGTHRLLVSAEIDCEEKLANGTREFVEVKTSGSMRNAESRCNFRERKLIKYWIQSYVAGVPTVVVGYRSEDGVLTVRHFTPPYLLPPHPLLFSTPSSSMKIRNFLKLNPCVSLTTTSFFRESTGSTLWKYQLMYRRRFGTATGAYSSPMHCSLLSG